MKNKEIILLVRETNYTPYPDTIKNILKYEKLKISIIKGKLREFTIIYDLDKIKEFVDILRETCTFRYTRLIVDGFEIKSNSFINKQFECFEKYLQSNSKYNYCEYDPIDKKLRYFYCNHFIPKSSLYDYNFDGEKGFFLKSKFTIDELAKYICPLFYKNDLLKKLNSFPDFIESHKNIDYKYISSGISFDLSQIRRRILEEKFSANYGFRYPYKVYFYNIYSKNLCDECKKLVGKIFNADELISIWKSHLNMIHKNINCSNCFSSSLFQINPQYCYLDENLEMFFEGTSKYSKDKHQEFLFKNNIILEGNSVLGLIYEKQKYFLENLKLKLSFQNKILAENYFNKNSFIIEGKKEIENWGDIFNNFFAGFGGKYGLGNEIIEKILNNFSKEQLEEKYFKIRLKIFEKLIQIKNYTVKRELNCWKLFGFDIIFYEDYYNITFADNYLELSCFNRLSKFDVVKGNWMTELEVTNEFEY